jgi:hypothetical protein
MNETYLPNAWGRVGRIWHVAQHHPNACDESDGAPEAPFKTISAAARRVDEYDTVTIDEGIYREEVELPRHGHRFYPESMVIFQAVPGKHVYLRGSDLFSAIWNPLGGGIWSAPLPDSLFCRDAYNPYAMGLSTDVSGVVRPCEAGRLTETRGQIFVNGQAYIQLSQLQSLTALPESFIVQNDGRILLVNFGQSCNPMEVQVELTVRKRCIRPTFAGPVFIETRGIVIEHAAEPGPFCKCRAQSIRRNHASGIEVHKTYNFPGCSGAQCTSMNNKPSYGGVDGTTLHASIIDDTKACLPAEAQVVEALSHDAGRTWRLDESSRKSISLARDCSYALDEQTGILMRHYVNYRNGYSADGSFAKARHDVMLEYSRDGGQTWSEPQRINGDQRYYTDIVPLSDGTMFWPFYERVEGTDYHHRVGTVVGRWNLNGSTVDWEQTGWIEVCPDESETGLAEPSVAQFADGRLFMVLRMGAVWATKNSSGRPSVKLYCISNDGGRSWSRPESLRYEDGQYVYSPASFQQTFHSIKNGRVYVLMNIIDKPTTGCDPRTALHLIEIDDKTLRAKRGTLTVIDEKHPEHHDLVRFSNWQTFQDRQSRNLILFMRQNMSEYCPIRFGYDNNQYRYEIVIPRPLDSLTSR